MLGKQAKILSPTDVTDLLTFADCTRNPIRNRVIVLLSAKAGMRAGEIANLTWDMVVDAAGQISNIIELRDYAAKKGSGRMMPMHPDLADALSVWRNVSAGSGHVVQSERGGPMTLWSGSTGHSGSLGWRDARPIRAAGPSSPARLGSSIMQAGPCGMFNCWQGIDRSKQPSGTSTATQMLNASSSR
jgi:integrase